MCFPCSYDVLSAQVCVPACVKCACVTFATQVYIEETEGSILEDDLEKER